MSNLRHPWPGDILKVYCASKLVWHYGVYSDNGKVIDMAPRKGIAERTWDEFSEGCQVHIEPRRTDDAPREVILRRARLRLGERGYNIFFKNCEHFVSWCRKGVSSSSQMLNYSALSIILLVLGIYIYRTSRKSH